MHPLVRAVIAILAAAVTVGAAAAQTLPLADGRYEIYGLTRSYVGTESTTFRGWGAGPPTSGHSSRVDTRVYSNPQYSIELPFLSSYACYPFERPVCVRGGKILDPVQTWSPEPPTDTRTEYFCSRSFSADGLLSFEARAMTEHYPNNSGLPCSGILCNREDFVSRLSGPARGGLLDYESDMRFVETTTDVCFENSCTHTSFHTNRNLRVGTARTAVRYVRRGPLDESCAPQTRRLALLNPFWTYPNGTAAVSLARLAGTLDSPASGRALLPSGPATPSELSLDGTSRIVVGLVTTDRSQPVRFSLTDARYGRLMPLRATLFSDPPEGVSTLEVSEFIAVPGRPGFWAAMAVLVAREDVPDFPGHGRATVRARQGTGTFGQSLAFTAPPVLLVHGLWANETSWKHWLWNFPRASFAGVRAFSYDNYRSINDPVTLSRYESAVLSFLHDVRRGGTVAAQVNVAGHSLGGLLTRRYWQWQQGRSTLVRSFGGNDINRLITVDTPHLGSPLAELLWSRRGLLVPMVLAPPFDRSATARLVMGEALRLVGNNRGTLADLMESGLGMPISGAIADLRPGNATLALLPAPSDFPYEAVAGYTTNVSGLELALNLVLRLAAPGNTADSLLTSRNDVIVSRASQIAGARPVRDFLGVAHTNPLAGAVNVLESDAVMTYVACRLRTLDPFCRETAPALSASAAQATAAVDVDITGLREIGASAITLEGPRTGLTPGSAYDYAVVSSGRTVTAVAYLFRDRYGVRTGMGASADTFTLHPRAAGNASLLVLATFEGGTYAVRRFPVAVNGRLELSGLRIEGDTVRIRSVGGTARLAVYGTEPRLGELDLTPAATYTVNPASAAVASVDATGAVRALAKGAATVTARYGTLTDTIEVRVGD